MEKIRASPFGRIKNDERLNANDIEYIISKYGDDTGQEPWLKLLRSIFNGVFTADNLDYVRRDAYMTGVSTDFKMLNV